MDSLTWTERCCGCYSVVSPDAIDDDGPYREHRDERASDGVGRVGLETRTTVATTRRTHEWGPGGQKRDYRTVRTVIAAHDSGPVGTATDGPSIRLEVAHGGDKWYASSSRCVT